MGGTYKGETGHVIKVTPKKVVVAFDSVKTEHRLSFSSVEPCTCVGNEGSEAKCAGKEPHTPPSVTPLHPGKTPTTRSSSRVAVSDDEYHPQAKPIKSPVGSKSKSTPGATPTSPSRQSRSSSRSRGGEQRDEQDHQQKTTDPEQNNAASVLVGAVLDVASATASMISSAFTLLTAPTPVKPTAVDEQATAQTPNRDITVPNAHGGEVVTPSVPQPNPARKLCLDSDGGDSDNTAVPATLDDTTQSRPQTRSKKVEETAGPARRNRQEKHAECCGLTKRPS